jgi:hypothetical protein
MDFLLVVAQLISGLGIIICCILVAVKMFQSGSTFLGILTIITCFCVVGHIIALVWGWNRAQSLNIKNLMIVYTIMFILVVAGGAISAVLGGGPLAQLGQ